jgi:hypothetical protein
MSCWDRNFSRALRRCNGVLVAQYFASKPELFKSTTFIVFCTNGKFYGSLTNQIYEKGILMTMNKYLPLEKIGHKYSSALLGFPLLEIEHIRIQAISVYLSSEKNWKSPET